MREIRKGAREGAREVKVEVRQFRKKEQDTALRSWKMQTGRQREWQVRC